ncbi:hypothetical protein EDD16DRAFT_1515351 [Pisolithus croceorrhizus]|nr:hypothetical protein EDD16DRAFT_1515351 [Pisolithus croceorrhizus]KAI6131309.1 hypothetical protein EV401DRAFT_1884010 [Pisolithus croceorrhizus]
MTGLQLQHGSYERYCQRGDRQGNAERQRQETAFRGYPRTERQAVTVAILNSKFGARVDWIGCLPGKMGKGHEDTGTSSPASTKAVCCISGQEWLPRKRKNDCEARDTESVLRGPFLNELGADLVIMEEELGSLLVVKSTLQGISLCSIDVDSHISTLETSQSVGHDVSASPAEKVEDKLQAHANEPPLFSTEFEHDEYPVNRVQLSGCLKTPVPVQISPAQPSPCIPQPGQQPPIKSKLSNKVSYQILRCDYRDVNYVGVHQGYWRRPACSGIAPVVVSESFGPLEKDKLAHPNSAITPPQSPSVPKFLPILAGGLSLTLSLEPKHTAVGCRPSYPSSKDGKEPAPYLASPSIILTKQGHLLT